MAKKSRANVKKAPASRKPPVKISLPFGDAVTGLLGVQPKPRKKSAKKKTAAQKGKKR